MNALHDKVAREGAKVVVHGRDTDMSPPWLRLGPACLLAGLAAGIIACASTPPSSVTPSRSTPPAVSALSGVPNLYDAQRQVDECIRSGRYDQDFANVVIQARDWLEKRARTAAKPAIVLDIDETSLSNWPAYRINGWGRVVNGECDLQQGPCGLRAWQALGQSKALASTLEGAHFASAADFKAPERRRITERGYTIVLALGDQESDLLGGYAERTFKLPNPVYYLP
jgi:HAD superfamily, subfamily IIIB (Acid phosphatase)